VTVALRRSGSPERALDSLYRRHAADIYRYNLAMLDREADAEDATQTTFLNAYRALERGERPRDGGGWLRAIALNVCREHYRRASRRPDEVSLDDDPGDLVQDPPTPEIGDVVRGLSHLPFNQRAALVMREFEGRSLADISVALGVSVSAVETLLFRARRSLREQLEGTLSCAEAERAISAQLDGALPRNERGSLRAHLRECSDCASLARRLRAQRSAIRSLALIPLPASLKLFAGGSGASAPAGAAGAAVPAAAGASASGSSLVAALGGSLAAKIAIAAAAGATAIGVGYVSLSHKSASPSASHLLISTTRGAARRAAATAVAASGTAAATHAIARHAPQSAAPGSIAAAHHARGTGSAPVGAGRGHSASTTSPGHHPNGVGVGHGRGHAPNGVARGHGSAPGQVKRGQGHGRGHGPKSGGGAGHTTKTAKPAKPSHQTGARHGKGGSGGKGHGGSGHGSGSGGSARKVTGQRSGSSSRAGSGSGATGATGATGSTHSQAH
jgi:RNA polymerase sigma factor (sigma-70 family)